MRKCILAYQIFQKFDGNYIHTQKINGTFVPFPIIHNKIHNDEPKF